MIKSDKVFQKADQEKTKEEIPVPKSGIKIELFRETSIRLEQGWGGVKIDNFTSDLILKEGISSDKPYKVEEIFFKDLLQYYYKQNAVKLLERIYFYLEPGGSVRIIMKDLKKVITKYAQYLDNKYLDMIYGKQKDSFSIIKYGYTVETLSELLQKAGFKEIKEVTPQVEYYNAELDMMLEAKRLK